jgi:hypothetical protein
MAQDEIPKGALTTLLHNHRREALDLAALGLSLAVTGWLIAPVPALVALCAFASAALIPLGPAGRGPDSAARDFLAAVPRRLVTLAVSAALLRYFLSLPLGYLWYGVLWPCAAWFLTAYPGAVAKAAAAGGWLMNMAIRNARRGTGRLSQSPRACEALRMLAATLAGLLALTGFLHNGIIGGGDGAWYTAVVADYLQQWRTGHWPVFVGQTRFAAIGTVIPLRVAPYLQHFTLLLDFATGRTLTPYLLLNLAVALSGAAGGLSAYLCLRSILPSRRLEALLLAVLYIWCPGVIGLPYTGQLFMSAMTMPYLPIVFTGIVRIFQRDDFSGWAMASGGCAACWMAHSPIGIWVSISVAGALVARWACGLGWTRRELGRVCAGALLFAGMCGYVFVSVATLAAEKDSDLPSEAVVENLRNFYPGLLLPVSHMAGQVTDLQIGWSLLVALVISCAVAWKVRSPAGRALSAIAVLLLCLSLPVPGVSRWLWRMVPQAVVTATNAVPIQRLMAILAACTVTLSACALAAWGIRRKWTLLFLVAAVAWTGFELQEFVHRGKVLQNTAEHSEYVLSAENFIPTRFSLGMLSYQNKFFSHGFMDYELEQRVMDEDMASYIVSDVGSLAPGADFGPKTRHAELAGQLSGSSPPGERVWVYLTPKFTLQPRRHYLLAMDFTDEDTRGVLILTGTGFYRAYNLPASGGTYSFGSTPLSSWVLPLSSSLNAPVELSLSFTNEVPDIDMAHYKNFARHELIEYDPDKLPVRLKSLLPYVAEVRSPAKGWFESFRYFTPGWTATVNGHPSAIRRSPNGLIAVPVGAGESEVRLAYVPPVPLLAAYWLTWVTWCLLAAFLLQQMIRGSFSWAGSDSVATLRDP